VARGGIGLVVTVLLALAACSATPAETAPTETPRADRAASEAAPYSSRPSPTPRAEPAGAAAGAPRFSATVTRIGPRRRQQMVGVSWRPGCPVPIRRLRVVDMPHWGFDHRVHRGELVVHRALVTEVVGAFRRLYATRFPIRRMRTIEAYGGSDRASMAADNTSAFNCRAVTGSPGRFSLHSYGRAIDVNPVENPFIAGGTVLPPRGRAYRDRGDVRPGMITARGRVVRAFRRAGFTWGGSWQSPKDYQHFEADLR
jgi:D-alanyl-D-alanine carboxypeptidase